MTLSLRAAAIARGTASPPHTTASPPHTTASPPHTTASPPHATPGRAARRIAALAGAAIGAMLWSGTALAQALPGTATGSQTGDASGPYAGLATAPEADLFTGAAQTSVPIQVPPGRLGLAPQLALSYSSSAGPSAYGYGWTLPLARIHRSLRYGAPRYDASDGFVLEMPGASIDLEQAGTAAGNYRPRIESTFPRIELSAARNFWRVIDKSGVAFTFGARRSARQGRGDGLEQTFAWLVERIEDPAGNTVEFEYRQLPGGLAAALPLRILYGGNSAQGMPAFAEVRFNWQPIPYPSVPFVSLRAGFREPLEVRLSSIETFTHGLAARRYDFSHETDEDSGDDRLVGVTLTAFAADSADDVRLPSTVFSYAPAVRRGWPTGVSSHDAGKSLVLPDIGPFRYGGKTTTIDTLDINGDAIVDYVDTHRVPAVVRLGTGQGFSAPRSWSWPAAPAYPEAPQSIRHLDGNNDLDSNVFDLDGDGFADIVDSRSSACGASERQWCVWRGSSDGFEQHASPWDAPGLHLRDTRKSGTRVVTDLVDLNGDGYLDYVDSSAFADGLESGQWKVFWNDGKRFAGIPAHFAAPLPYLARWQDGHMIYGIFDLNADAMPDLVVSEPGPADAPARWEYYREWLVYLGDGHGFAASPTSWPIESASVNLPNFLALQAVDGSVISDLLDINGDGRPDLVRRNRTRDYWRTRIPDTCGSSAQCPGSTGDETGVAPGYCCYNVLVFLNTGASFSAPMAWTAPTNAMRTSYEACPFSAVQCGRGWVFDYDLFDFNGDGLIDLVQRAAAGDPLFTWRVYLNPATPAGDLAHSPARPNLLVSMMNGIGGQTLLGYRSASAAPDTSIPFPYWTVVQREIRDGVYATPSRHAWISYRGGRYDASYREVRGFALVQQVDDLGITHVREFHQDSVRKGRLRRLSVLGRPACAAIDPSDPADPCSPWQRPLSRHEYTWPDRSPVLLASESEVPFGPAGAVEALRKTTSYTYDAYGNPAGRVTSTPLAASTTLETRFAAKVTIGGDGLAQRYTVDKPVDTRVLEDGRVSPLLERRFEYDWQGPAFGALQKSMTCIAWQGETCTSWSVRTFQHDGYGNLVSTQSPSGETSMTGYDASALFPVTSRDAAGLLTTSVYDPRTGSVTETIDPAGIHLQSQFDGLGRLLRTWGPGTSRQSPLGSNRYWPGSLAQGPPRIVTHRAGAAPSATFFDGLGRTMAAKTLRATEQGVAAEVAGLQQYNIDGTVARKALPLRVGDTSVGTLDATFADAEAWIETLYDEQGRPAQTIYPDGSRTRVDRTMPGILVSYDANISAGATAARATAEDSTAGTQEPGAVTIELFDGLGRRLERDVCSSVPVAPAPYDCAAGTLEKRESWFYDGLGRIVATQVHALGKAAGDSWTRVVYDGLGNRASVSSSDAGTWNFTHDPAGRPSAIVRPDGVRVAYAYDRAGRLLRQRGPLTSSSWRYFSSGDGIGKVRRISTRSRNARAVHSFAYDARGRLGQESWLVVVRGDSAQRMTLRYRYDDLDRRTAIEYPTAASDVTELIATGFDEFGNAISLSSSRTTYVAHAAYDLYGRLSRIDYGNGLSDRVSHEPWSNAQATRGRLRCLRTTSTASGGSACETETHDLDALWYRDYDRNGNLLAVADPLHPAVERLHDGRSYAYDALGRLALATYGDGTSESFEFDPLGNLVRKGNGRFDHSDPQRPSQLSAVSSDAGAFTAGFDDNGNRIRSGDYRFSYDEMLRLTGITFAGEPVAAYGYDEAGHRIYRYDAAGDRFRYEFGDLVATHDGSIDRMIYFGDRLVAVDRVARTRSNGDISQESAARLFLHEDHQRTPRLITDGAGNVVERARFGAFGERRATLDASGAVLPEAAADFGFTGHLEERASGLLFLGSRYYDPATGSFLTIDPASQFSSPYAYSDGNPVLGTDPGGAFFGLTPLELVIALTGSATLIDSLVQTGDLGHSLTAGISAGFSVYTSHQLSAALARPLGQVVPTWALQAASIASEGLQVRQAIGQIDDGNVASGVVSIGLLAGSLIGIESATDPGPDGTREERYATNGIVDRGVENGTRVIEVNGICSTRPGCASSFFTALRENLSVLFGNKPGCVNGCAEVKEVMGNALKKPEPVRLLCNSFGAIKCARALQEMQTAAANDSAAGGLSRVKAELSGAPLLRPPKLDGVTYQANLFDPVVWVGTLYSIPLRSDVVLGTNWWLPLPLVVHHSRLYEKPVAELLGSFGQ